MIKNLEDISETRKRLTVEIPADEIEEKIQQSLNELRMRTKIPGFRPGKAPLSLLDKRFGDQVQSDVLEKVVPEYYAKALQEANLSPVTQPDIEKTDFKRKTPFEMTFTIEVMPRVEDLQYEGLKVKEEEVDVADEEMEEALKRVQAEKISYDPVDRPAEDNDVVTLDYEIVEEGKKYENQIIKVGSDQYPESFSEGIKGKSKDDSFEVSVTFPDDHHSELKGKTLSFKGTVKEIKVLILPDIDENFAKDIGYQDLSALKDSVKADILAAKKTQVKKKQIVELIDELIESHDFPVPESMLNAELSSLLTAARAKEENKDKDEESLKAELKPEAEKGTKAAVLLNIIGKKEKITVTEEEMKEKVLELSQMTMIPPQNLIQMYMSKDGSLEGLRYGIYKEKVADLIHSKAQIEKGD